MNEAGDVFFSSNFLLRSMGVNVADQPVGEPQSMLIVRCVFNAECENRQRSPLLVAGD